MAIILQGFRACKLDARLQCHANVGPRECRRAPVRFQRARKVLTVYANSRHPYMVSTPASSYCVKGHTEYRTLKRRKG
jgi:hypothetical protein